MFLMPNIIPKTLEELARQPDEGALLAKKEEELKAKLTEIRDYNRNKVPSGMQQMHQQEGEDVEDDDVDEDVSDVEEAEEDETDGAEEEDDEDAEGDDDVSEDLDFGAQ